MANQQKKDYVSELYSRLEKNPHFVLIGFEKSSHQRLEEFRGKLREIYKDQSDMSELMVIKNSLFRVAFEKLQKADKNLTKDDMKIVQDLAKGQTMLLLIPGDWARTLKVVHTFAEEEEGMSFRAGRIEGIVYQESGLQSVAKLPGKEELVIKIINSLRSSQTRLVYGLQFNTIKLVNVLKNASEKGDGAQPSAQN